MFCTDISAPTWLIFSNSTPPLLYYSHIPTMLVSLFIGFFVLLKGKSLASKILFCISLLFFIWAFFSLIVWTNINSKTIIFYWSFFGILYSMIYILSLYFVYVFIDKKDISFLLKIIFALLLLPIIILTATKYNLSGFDLVYCEAQENSYFTYYYYGLGLVVSLWIFILAILRHRKAESEMKKQIIPLTIGIEFFLVSFFITGFLASYLVEKGLIADFGLEQYGLFGMAFFMAFLAYLIVKFEAFNIKMFGAQALVAGLVILISSQFFFIKTFANQILTGITLFLSVGFGWMLIVSVKKEMERKEELQIMADSLANANDQLRKLDNSKSEFISIASHQLRTPLTAIKGFVSLIQEGSYGKVEPKIKEVLNKIFISNERLIELVEDLLNISRIESGRMDYRIEKFKLEELINELYDTFSARAKKKGLKLEMIFPENSFPEIETDRNKMREIISNLIDNAIKYTAKGWVRIKVSYADGIFRVAIIDTGMGTLKEDISFLFSKFSRGTGASRVNAGGTGLGLHVGKRMIEALGGKIWVESEGAEKGSTFFVEAPIKYAERK